jgi:hypothetical protein
MQTRKRRMSVNSSNDLEKEKERVIGWSHETLRYCLTVYGLEAGRKGEPAPTQALSLAHDLWDRAVKESGEKPDPEHVGLMCARIVLDWCAGYRAK